MKVFTARSTIRSPVALVWSVLSDVRTWPSWTPTVSRVEALVPLATGARVLMVQPRLRSNVWHVSDWNPPQSFVWTTGGWGYRILALHLLTPSTRGCEVVLRLAFEGFLSPLLARMWGSTADRYIREEADRLKVHCEALASSSGDSR